jgi:two-component system, chemotaxis family, chemotaxis protein CheY
MRLLVVDDEVDVKSLFEQRFRKEIRDNIYSIHFAFNAESALEYLDQAGSEAVLILSDINMPGMSGLDLLQEIKTRKYNPTPMVMMITAYGDEENYQSAMKFGADDFLTKPIEFSILKQRLIEMLS